MGLILCRFGNAPVLAKRTTHVAAGGPHGEYARSGQKMIERLLFDGVDLECGGRAIAQAVELAAAIHAYEAETALPFSDVAVPRAQVAVHTAVGHGLPPAPFVRRRRCIQDFQFCHDLATVTGETAGPTILTQFNKIAREMLRAVHSFR